MATSGAREGKAADGTAYRYRYHTGSKNVPSSFAVEVPCRSAGAFHVSPERGLERLSKRLRVSVELQTGDPDFDDALYRR